MKISISKDSDWQIGSFAKAPIELLLCDDLLPTSKLLWIVLANQANFRPIDRTVLDRRIGIHRSTRSRCMSELRDLGFISGTDSHIVVHDPSPIIKRLEETDRKSREQAKVDFGIEQVETVPEVKQQKQTTDYFAIATECWNKYRPNDYQKVRRLSSQLLKAIDLHIKALGLKTHDYEGFFSVLNAGVAKSSFWSEENTSKTLQSIIGIGSPQTQKYQNVQTLYDLGLEHGAINAREEEERQDTVVLPSALRKTIDEYEELHHMYRNLQRSNPSQTVVLTQRIINVENELRQANLNPAKFRLKYQLSDWPTDTPEPSTSREKFWRYDDEI